MFIAFLCLLKIFLNRRSDDVGTVFGLLLFVLIVEHYSVVARTDWSVEKDASFWNQQARSEIENKLKKKVNTRTAKNVILFLGDGMGINTVTAGRIRKGQVNNQLGEDFLTEMEQLDDTGFSKTYNIDYQTADSAATATAFLCGVKAQLGTIGVDGRTSRANCLSSIDANVESILDWAQKLGRKVGIITNARVTHATPAGAYAHVAERDWESFDGIYFNHTQQMQGCLDIAYQLMIRNPPIDLIMGGGRQHFFQVNESDVEYPSVSGFRIDNQSLINKFWKGEYVWNMTQMSNFTLGSQKPLLGLFEPSHMMYESKRRDTNADEPSLTRMTEFALEHFLKFDQGFFLLIEGGRIDHAHHDTKTRNALDEFVEFDNAIGRAKQILQEKGVLDDSLIVVTADHSHVFSIGAYAARGSNILGFSNLEGRNVSDIDKSPVNIISYGNGPAFNVTRNATVLAQTNFNSTDYLFPAALPLSSETHGGEDVPVYSSGPWSHLFTGTFEQHSIAHKMAYAACWGPYQNRTGCSIVSSATELKLAPFMFFYFIFNIIF